MAARESRFRAALRESNIPREYREPLLAWIEQGVRPASPVLQAVIQNDLRLGVSHYPEHLSLVADFMLWNAPAGSAFAPSAWTNWPMHRQALARQAEQTLAWAFRELTTEDLVE